MTTLRNTERKLAAIVFTDIVGFTKITADDQSKALDLLNQQRKLLKPLVESHNGQWVKELGDGLLLTFNTVIDAVNCSIKIQHITKDIESLNLRIGIHQGEIIVQENDVLGDDVNIASRIEPFSAPGGIAISNKVNDAIIREKEFETKYVGKPKLKGVSQVVEVFCIVSHYLPATDLSKISAKLEKEGFKYNIFTLTGGLFTLIGFASWLSFSILDVSIAGGEDNSYLRGTKSIAVLYFDPFSTDKDIEFLCSGMTESVINALTKIGAFRVKSRNDVFKYKNQRFDFNQIRNDLNVSTILQGSLQKFKDKLRISTQLIDAKTGNNLWAANYDRSTEDMLNVQDEISQEIAKTLGIELNLIQDNILKAKPTENVKAYELLGKAIYFSDNGKYDSSLKVLDSIMVLDPNYKSALFTRGVVLEKQREYVKAEKIYNDLLPKINKFSRIDWKWVFPEISKDKFSITTSGRFAFNDDLGIGIVSQNHKGKEFIYGIDVKANKQIWTKSINDSYLSDSHIWEDLIINVSSRFYPSQKGEASIYANEIKSGKNIFSLEFAREFLDQTVHPFLLPVNNTSSDIQKPFMVYLKVNEGSSLINVDPKNGKILWNIKLSDKVNKGLPYLWMVNGKNNQQFILHRKGVDLYLINLASGVIEWTNQLEKSNQQLFVQKSQLIIYDKNLGKFLIKNITDWKDIAQREIGSPIKSIIGTHDKFIVSSNNNIYGIDLNPGLFNWSLIDWNTIVEDDIIINTYGIGKNIFVTLESGSVWCINIENGNIIGKANTEMRDLKVMWNNDVKKIICYNQEYVIGLDYFSGDVIWKMYNSNFFNAKPSNIQFLGDKLILINSGNDKSDLIIDAYNSLSGELLWNKTEKSLIKTKYKYFDSERVVSDINIYNTRLFIYDQNQIIEINIRENPDDRIIPQKDVLFRLGSINKEMGQFKKAEIVLNKIVNSIDQQNKSAIRLLAEVYEKLDKKKEFNSLIADYINLLPQDSNERMTSIELLKKSSNLNWIISLDCIRSSMIDEDLIMLDYQCDKNKPYKLVAHRQHSGIKVWESELDISRSLYKQQDKNNLFIVGRKDNLEHNCDNDDCIDHRSGIYAINKRSGKNEWYINVESTKRENKIKKIYLHENLLILENIFNDTLQIKAFDSNNGKMKWERMWAADNFYLLSETDIIFHKNSLLFVLEDEFVSLNVINGQNNWTLDISDVGEISYLSQNSVLNNKVILVNDEDEIVYFDLELKEVLGIHPFPIDDIFKLKINYIYESNMYFHIPDGRLYAVSFDKSGVKLKWNLDFNFPTEWLSAKNGLLNILDAESNKSITISALDGNITSQQYLIWDPQDVYIKNSNIYSIGDGNIYSQSQGIE